MTRLLQQGDPCPFCGAPIPTDDSATLELLTVLAERMGLPLLAAEMNAREDGDRNV